MNFPKHSSTYTNGSLKSFVGSELLTFDADKADIWKTAVQTVTVTGDTAVTFGIQAEKMIADVYIDNLTIAKKTTINFDAQGAFVEPIKGLPGAEATLPTDVVIADKTFEGWYLDAGLTQKAENIKFPADKLSITLYAKFDDSPKAPTYKYNFDTENAGMLANSSVEGTQVSGGAFSIINDPTSGTNGKVLAINNNLNTHNHCVARDIVFNNGSSLSAIPAGKYDITFNYYAEYVAPGGYTGCSTWCKSNAESAYNNPADFALYLGAVAKTGYSHTSDANVKYAKTENLFAFDVVSSSVSATAGWQQGSATLIITDEMVLGGRNYLSLSINELPYKVFLDNIVLTQVTEPDVTVTFDLQGGEGAIGPVTGKAGQAITVANPTRSGYTFTGWYYDASLAESAEMVIPSADKTFYAGWVLERTDFNFDEGLYKNFAVSGFGSGIFSVQTKDPADSLDNKTLAVNADTSKHNHGNSRGIAFNNGTEKLTLNAGTYEIKYKYFAKYMPAGSYNGGNAENCTCSTAAKDIYDNEYFGTLLRFAFVDGSFNSAAELISYTGQSANLIDFNVVSATNPTSGWQTASVYVDVTEEMVAAGENTLILRANLLPYAVYLDDISVNELEIKPVSIHFDSKGGSSCETVSTSSYSPVELPVPTKTGYKFVGWYHLDMTTPASERAPANDITYYAKWQEIGKYVLIDFESEFLAGTSSEKKALYGSDYFKKTETGDTEHGFALKYKVTDGMSHGRAHTLSANGVLAELAPTTSYTVKFDYYIKSLPENSSFTFDFLIKSKEGPAYDHNRYTRLSGTDLLSAVTTKSTALVGKWITVETVVTTPAEIGSGVLGLYCIDGAGAEIYFDNIEFSALGADAVVLTYTIPATEQTAYIVGKAGDLIDTDKIPVLNSQKYVFGGWFTTEAFDAGSEFSAKYMPKNNMTIYGKATAGGKVSINFEDYPWKYDTSSSKISNSTTMSVVQGLSSDGDGWALKIDNTTDKQTEEAKNIMLNIDGSPFALQNGERYIISYDYYIQTLAKSGSFKINFASCSKASMWGNSSVFTPVNSHNIAALPAKQWFKGNVMGEVTARNNGTYLKAQIATPLNSIVYIDNITVRHISEGYSAVTFAGDLTTYIPEPIVVKTNANVSLPSYKSVLRGKRFVFWNDGTIGNIQPGKYTVSEDVTMFASIITEKVIDNFENFDSSPYKLNASQGYDDDWEIYDSAANGNSAENVRSGRYSMHRIGKEYGTKTYSVFMNNALRTDAMIFGANYTVSMWVKVENPVHTLGAIEIASNTSYMDGWSISGDRHAIAAVKDISDGEWHKLSFTFTALTRYLAIYTPGNLSIYFDDITIEYAGDIIPSADVTGYERYVPKPLTNNGEYVIEENTGTLSDFQLVKRTETVTEGKTSVVQIITNNVWALLGVIAAAVVILCGAGVLIVLFVKRNKAKGGNK